MDRRSKMLPEVGQRMMHSEMRTCRRGRTPSPPSPARSARRRRSSYRLLGETEGHRGAADQDPRQLVMAWMRRPDNPYFARAIVNRVWAHYFGRGIIDPPDNLSSFNPASHPELLKELCRAASSSTSYDLKWLHRTILASRTYQQSSTAEPGQRDGPRQLRLLLLSPAARRGAARRPEPGDRHEREDGHEVSTTGPSR